MARVLLHSPASCQLSPTIRGARVGHPYLVKKQPESRRGRKLSILCVQGSCSNTACLSLLKALSGHNQTQAGTNSLLSMSKNRQK